MVRRGSQRRSHLRSLVRTPDLTAVVAHRGLPEEAEVVVEEVPPEAVVPEQWMGHDHDDDRGLRRRCGTWLAWLDRETF